MGSGIAKQIRERWPEVFNAYVKTHKYHIKFGFPTEDMLGYVEPIHIDDGDRERYVVNMYSQHSYGYNAQRYTSYDAFACCLHKISAFVHKDKTIGFPKNIGCGLGGGNWKVISALIEEILGQDYDVYIYELEGA
jgi:hypothetical protein